ncbi:NERD domain-containing protein [Cytobacillus spongiae]|uniref:nuclease-related domain-containing protein n=1 Tax=Cytobacillus spongiae TaxID=2901381 RepID=UPI001F187D34|nr:nuclease-related domain-containing protein [Cytobacillus spongiae]UII56440.1 NERD domain-containing protein [Cytobacillus spongiae]
MHSKERKVPVRILQLQALLRRLPASHSKRAEIEANLAKQLAGFKGEKSIDYYLTYLPSHSYTILHDLRLKDNVHFFQIDTLIISSKFILIIEVKNISGTLFFDKSFNQLVRTIHQKEEGFPDPTIQVNRQHQHLMNWLAKHNFSKIPVCWLIVISNPSTIIKSDSNIQSICHAAAIEDKVATLEKNHPRDALVISEIRKLTRILQKNNLPISYDILQKFELSFFDLIRGVQCPTCMYIPMNRIHGCWHCPNCSSLSKSAHIDALQDYALIVSKTIKNKDASTFLQLTSRHTAKRLLGTYIYKKDGYSISP